MTSTTKTRFLIISDTHNASRSNPQLKCEPFPKCDVLLHCGDLTMVGRMQEYQTTFDMLKDADAELKLVIAGNHDISLDETFYKRRGRWMQLSDYDENMPQRAREAWTGAEAMQHNILYLDEGVYSFTLRSGAKFTVYASPYQPEFCDWAFPYERDEDRFNPGRLVAGDARSIAEHPIPDFPNVDIVMTHGPPLGIRDQTYRGENVGCEHLLKAVARARPRVHAFGHIHEGYGVERVTWDHDVPVSKNIDPKKCVKGSEYIEEDDESIDEKKATFLDVSAGSAKPLRFGEETLMVNAAMMNLRYRPVQAPWVVDLDLLCGENSSG